jgi:hypothetical protein
MNSHTIQDGLLTLVVAFSLQGEAMPMDTIPSKEAGKKFVIRDVLSDCREDTSSSLVQLLVIPMWV